MNLNKFLANLIFLKIWQYIWINSLFFKFSYIACNKFKRNISVLLIEGSDIELAKLVIKCPYCQWLFEVRPPDAIHSDFSFRMPSQISFHGEVIKRSLRCPNPRCGEQFEIYWFSRANHFPKIFSLQPQEPHDNRKSNRKETPYNTLWNFLKI